MSFGLVLAQFGLLAALVWQVYLRWPHLQMSEAAAASLALAVALGVWTLMVNRPGNFNVVPEPKEDGRLVTTGPYEWIRHPMYTSVLLFAAGCALLIHGWWAWFTWLCLLLVLSFKALVEERMLLKQFAGYASYMRQTKRFLPGIL